MCSLAPFNALLEAGELAIEVVEHINVVIL